MNSINISFSQPWLLLLIIPLIGLALRPFLSLPHKMRYMKKRIASLVIHIVMLVLLTLIVAGINVENQYVAIKSDVIILVDRSISSQASKSEMDNMIKSIIDESPEDYRVGLVEFGKNSQYVSPLSTNKTQAYDYLDDTITIDRSATDINQALMYAYEQLSNPNKGRIILISDGRQTDANALITAKSIADSGARLDVFYIQSKTINNDAQISVINIPNDVQLGNQTSIEVLIDSTLLSEANLTVSYETATGDIETETKAITLSNGINTFSFIHQFSSLGVTQIKATLETAETDAVIENNTQYGFVHIEDRGSNKVLIIEGVSGESSAIQPILTEDGYEVDIRSIDDLPTSIGELIMYGEIILINVKNEDLVPTGFHSLLETYVKNYGGGLLTIGGNRAYQKQDMIGESVDQTFSDLLPIESSTDPKAMAVVIVMDASSSMISNGSQKFNLAKAGAIASLESLASQNGETSHQFGLVTFDANLKDVINLTSVDNKDTIIPQIEALLTGSGTYYTQGLQKAKDMLSQPQYANTQKHIIFLTDGGPRDAESQYMAVLNSLTDISVSTIALGADGENDLNPALVESMVREFNGRGAFYRVENQNQLESVMLEDTQQAQAGDFVNEVPFVGIINTIIPALAGLSEMPELGGYYGTRGKVGANVVIQSTEGDPIFALWVPEDSLGRVASFTSDLNGIDFSKDFVDDFVGKAFIRGIVKSVMPSVNIGSSDMSVGFIDENLKTTVRIRSNIDEGEIIQANVTNPLGETSRISLSTISKTTLGGSFQTNIPGLYQLEVKRYNQNGQVVSELIDYKTFAYSQEYEHAFDEEEAISIMESIAENGNGTFLRDTNNMFSREAETVYQQFDTSIILITIIMTMFLADIVIRKFKFRWSNDYVGKNYRSDVKANQLDL